jgi:hypothetical protein
MDSEWQPWLPSTTETSGLFKAPLADTWYAFRVTAYDRAGNSAQALTTAYVEPQHAYLAVLSNRWRDWYRHDVYEPNDTPPDAFGPLKSDQTYQSYIWNEEDVSDYFWFIPVSTQQVRISLTNIPAGKDYDLYVYYHEDGLYKLHRASNYSGSGPEYIAFIPEPNTAYGPGTKFFVRVYPFDGFGNNQPFHLKVIYR